MKKLFALWMFVLLFASTSGTAFAIGYCKDFLEDGNPGGWEISQKTWDDEWTVHTGEEIVIDIWLNDLHRDDLITAGFYLFFEPSDTIINVEIYDGVHGPPGPWDPGFTSTILNPAGQGTFVAYCGNFSLAPPDADGDVIIGRLTIPHPNPGDIEIDVGVFGL